MYYQCIGVKNKDDYGKLLEYAKANNLDVKGDNSLTLFYNDEVYCRIECMCEGIAKDNKELSQEELNELINHITSDLMDCDYLVDFEEIESATYETIKSLGLTFIN